MPQTPHIERHFTGSDTVRDIVIGKEEFVTKELGLWIDHREAVIVTITDKREETKQIKSGMEKHVRFSGGSGARELHGIQESEDKQDRRFEDHLNAYYDAVIACIRDADSILIFGPGEAKVELKKRLEGQHLGERIVGIETFDKMSDRQVAAKVRQHFSKQRTGTPLKNKP